MKTLRGDCRDVLPTLPAESVHCIVTSPPYFGLRDYGVAGQIGLEATPDAYVAELVGVFRECRRVLRNDGTLWLNLGDSYATNIGGIGNNPSTKSTLTTNNGRGPKLGDKYSAENRGRPVRIQHGVKPKDLIGIPWMVAFALRADGWYLRSDIIWSKPNPMPESVSDRPTKAHEYLFLLSKAERYFYDAEAIAEAAVQPFGDTALASGMRSQHKQAVIGQNQGPSTLGANFGASTRNCRSVWTVATQPFSEAHFATFPPALIEPCIKAGCPIGGTVLDPFGGAGTTGLVADRLQRNAILIELNPEYAAMAARRIADDRGGLLDVMEQHMFIEAEKAARQEPLFDMAGGRGP